MPLLHRRERRQLERDPHRSLVDPARPFAGLALTGGLQIQVGS